MILLVSSYFALIHGNPIFRAADSSGDGLEQLGGPDQICQCQLEEQILSRLCRGHIAGNVTVIGRAVPNRVIKDRGIRSEPRYREVIDVVLHPGAFGTGVQ
jgi:hypothetical protein